jgi:DNA primase
VSHYSSPGEPRDLAEQRLALGWRHPASVEVAGRTLEITHPDKVFFPAHGDTKLDLVRFYVRIGDAVMRAMRDRPVLLQRFPSGSAGSSFFQKRIPDSAPEWLETTIVSTPNGTESRALVIADLAHFLWAVNIGCLGFHAWAIGRAVPRCAISSGSISIPDPAPRSRWRRRPRPR